MIASYLKNTWRNIIKDRQFTLLNLLGLATGLASAFLIYLWVSDELHMDKSFANDSRIFQVMKNSVGDGSNPVQTHEWTPGPLAKALKEEMPEVAYGVTVVSGERSGMGVISVDDKHIRTSDQYAGKDFFNIFSYPLLSGDRDNVLKEKVGVVISDQLAMRLFNTTDNITGKKIEWTKKDIKGSYVISGVFKKPLYNSSASFDVVFPIDLYREKNPNLDDWTFGGPNTYVLLKENTSSDAFNKKIAGFLQKKTKDNTQYIFIRRYSDKYLFGKYENGIQAGGRISYVRLFSIVALFLLVIACVNFMNLSTAKAAGRIKEVGVRKVMGAGRASIALQFMGESVMMAFLALVIALILVAAFFFQFQEITGKHFLLDINPALIFTVLGITLFTGLISGSYPALYLSGFSSAGAFKGKVTNAAGELWVRKGLVIFQFTISALLIVAVSVVYKQMKFVQSTNIGFSKDNIIVFKKEGSLNSNMQTFLREVKTLPGIVNASNTENDLTINYSGTDGITWPGKASDNSTGFKYLFIGYDFIETLGIDVRVGRSFSQNSGSRDSSSAIIFNEAAIAAMGLKNPIGQIVKLWGSDREIVGVVGNFHIESLYEKVKPCFFLLSPGGDNLYVKIRAGKEKETIAQLQTFYQKFNPGFPFDFRFLDRDFQVLYESENRVVALSWYFAGIAVIISCLGLFGLAAFTAQKRQKEIGIRKVVGATTGNVLVLLSGDFLKLVMIAILIAFPLAWWITHRWLNSFAYRVDIGAEVYLISGAMMILITILTISYQAVKSAIANPVKTLRSE